MFSDIHPNEVPGWVCVHTTSTELDANMVSSYLESNDIEVQIMSKQDSAIGLTVGELAVVFIYVPEQDLEKAAKAIEEWQAGDIELEDQDE